MENIRLEKRLLWSVLLINFFFFVLEITTGVLGHSIGLVADSLDMLADAIVYGLSLLAIGGLLATKKRIARLSGYFQMLLAVVGFVEVVRRSFGIGENPDYRQMIIVSILALIGNSICLYLLKKRKSSEVHMTAAMIFTSNDVVINIGVIVAGSLVFLTSSRVPDLVVGSVIFVIVIKAAIKILKLSRQTV